MRFHLTAVRTSDALQILAPNEGQATRIVIGDAAYSPGALREAIAFMSSNPSRASKYPIDKQAYPQRHLVECRALSSSSSEGWLHASIKPPETSWLL